ncbi:protein-L-isoaspartate(D-aspartate) O-methyltransferase [Streptomyces sp. NPDC057654]|uniref:protein-L-isoaspartate(D-aspartate) O-methyltransferase n=1 Tax=Streptomyces sp. NPDC057654 TaxID=3346196 RepID=UPI0036BBE141
MASYAQLVDGLHADGLLADRWREVFLATPRAGFVPDTVWVPEGDGYREVDRRRAPRKWERLVNSRAVLITQLDDGQPNGPQAPTSSSSMPAVVAEMLQVADVRPGMRVLEAGGGTGWTAALTCRMTGDGSLTTVEVDTDLAGQCAKNLAAAGLPARVVHGDAVAGYPPAAPYDRLSSTVAVRSIPPAWLAQVRPGGTITTPFHTPFAPFGLLQLTVAADGRAASGRFCGGVSFMWLRSQRPDNQAHGRIDKNTRRVSHAPQPPKWLADETGAWLGAGLHHPELSFGRHWSPQDPQDTYRVRISDRRGSLAVAFCHEPWTVLQYGPRSLWDETAAPALVWWDAHGRPGITRYGITVHPDGTHHAWLDDPRSQTWQLVTPR